MKKAIFIFLVMVILFGGGAFLWIQNAKKAVPATNNQKTSNPGATQKSGTTTKTGKITASDGKFYLQEVGQTPNEIDSYAVDLSEYANQTVTVSGQYSGDTLFVGSITK